MIVNLKYIHISLLFLYIYIYRPIHRFFLSDTLTILGLVGVFRSFVLFCCLWVLFVIITFYVNTICLDTQ